MERKKEKTEKRKREPIAKDKAPEGTEREEEGNFFSFPMSFNL